MLGGVLIPVFLRSDNVHAIEESVAFDRLLLGLRTFWPEGRGDAPGTDGLPPFPANLRRWALDPNFPLGTAFVFGLPHALGVDPVTWGRLHSLAWAMAAALAWGASLARAGGAAVGALGGAAVFTIPAFTRGAVVSGEEAPYAGLYAVSTWLLLRARDAWNSGEAAAAGRARRSALLAALAGSATVLFRLDALTLLPGLALAGLLALGRRRGLLFGAALGLGGLLHLGVSWRVYGDPLNFAHNAARVTRDTASPGGDFHWARLPEIVAWQAAGPLGPALLALAALGVVALLRRDPAEPAEPAGWTQGVGPVLALLSLWLACADEWIVVRGSMQPRLVRYLVPMLMPLPGLAILGAAAWVPGPRRRLALGAALAVFGTAAAAGVPRAWADAAAIRLPDGLEEACRAAGEAARASGVSVVVSGWHPECTLFSRLPPGRIQPIVGPRRGPPDALQLRAEIERRRADLLVAVEPDAVARLMRDEGPWEFRPLFASGRAALWSRVPR
jgi:hypothetical protein